jgi:hypothetical protein
LSASEFAFLTLGLMLGSAVGAALVEVLRTRPPAPPAVRVTVTPGSVPIRGSTLATDPFSPISAGPAPFGPADRRRFDRIRPTPPVKVIPALMARPATVPTKATGTPSGRRAQAPASTSNAPPSRTPVLPSRAATVPLQPGGGFAGPMPESEPAALVPVRIEPETDGLFEALAAAQARAVLVLGSGGAGSGPDEVDRGARSQADDAGARPPTRTAVADPPRDDAGRKSVAPGARTGSTGPGEPGVPPSAPRSAPPETSPGQTANGPCAELRATAQDRCAVATRAREGAEAAREALREAHRSYDDHTSRADAADAVADPRAIRAAKESAQAGFRRSRDGARAREELERAATEWLSEINRINAEAREALARANREQAAARALVATIERLEVEADAARISAESADEACVAARQAVADCQEATEAATPPPTPAGPTYGGQPDDAGDVLVGAPGEREARIVRLLRGDRDALTKTVAELAGDDPDERTRWQLALTGLVDAIVAQAAEASAIDLPEDDAFWGLFSAAQRRDIVTALSSLGFRYDGMRGFADDRVPGQRDLSLAVGYAGFDPMRIRRWPSDTELHDLYGGASVAAAEYLVDAAAGLTLGELIALLGRRADGLTDLWNDWGRVRPRLLATD